MSVIALVENFSPEMAIGTRRVVVVVAVPDFVGGTRRGDSETASEEARASRHSATADERNPLVTRSK